MPKGGGAPPRGGTAWPRAAAPGRGRRRAGRRARERRRRRRRARAGRRRAALRHPGRHRRAAAAAHGRRRHGRGLLLFWATRSVSFETTACGRGPYLCSCCGCGGGASGTASLPRSYVPYTRAQFCCTASGAGVVLGLAAMHAVMRCEAVRRLFAPSSKALLVCLCAIDGARAHFGLA